MSLDELEKLRNKIETLGRELASTDDSLFDIQYNKDKIIFGNQTPDRNDTTGKWFKFRALYQAVCDLSFKIGITFDALLDFDYQLINKNFNPCIPTTKLEFHMFYYLENILYRQITLWDVLAQFYNVHYEVNMDVEKINYKRFFHDYSTKQYLNVAKIYQYIKNQEDAEISCSNKATHQYVSDYRNSLAHRLSESTPSMSNLGIHLKEHPLWLLQIIIEDLEICISFYDDILEEILSDENKEKLLKAFLPKGKGLIMRFGDKNE